MTKINKLFTSVLAIGLSTVSIAYANDLTVVNHTKRDSTARINNTGCSSDMGIVTKAGETKNIDSGLINLACLGHAKNCKAEVFMTANCDANGAKRVAIVMFDTSKGIKSISMNTNEYKITGRAFTIQLDGGPNSK